MTLLDQTYEASYNDIPFFVRSVSTTGGRKTVTHEFVGTDKREVQDLGRLQKVFSLQAETANTGDGYFVNKNALLNELDKGGKGVLMHPFYGRVEVVPKPYTVVEQNNDLGLAKFQLVFERAEEKITPLSIQAVLNNIGELADEAFDNLGTDIEDDFEVSSGFPTNFERAADLLNDISDAYDSATQIFDRAVGEINNFKAQLDEFRNKIFNLVSLPGELATRLKDLFQSSVALMRTPADAVLMLEDFFNFGDNLNPIPTGTVETQERQSNQDLLTSYMQAGALAESYRQTSLIEFETLTELDTFAAKLDAQFEIVMPTVPNTETALSIQELRDITSEFLDSQRLTVKQLIEINTETLPAQVLAYQYYGNVDDVDKIIEANTIKDVSFVAGSVEILTA
jgi:prophage DNA circulation protein